MARNMASTRILSSFEDCPQPKSMYRAKRWDDAVENAFRFQEAGYRDELEYKIVRKVNPEKWECSGYVKKLQRKDGTFYYYNRARECKDKEVHKIKFYQY